MICIFKLTLRPPPHEPGGDEELGAGTTADGALVASTDSALMQKRRAYIWGQLACAAVLVLATAAKSTSVDLWGYSLSVGLVALVASCTSVCLQANSAGSRVLFSPAKLGPITINGLVSTFLLLWWLVGTLLLTIVSPFVLTGNGCARESTLATPPPQGWAGTVLTLRLASPRLASPRLASP